ncbi:glycerol-3-phosphate 1-O-acyltransferase PlsY [Pelagibaculum spongiae]|uniref:Glycerol-3-phosphate acyltransferase n=2 Tax=Pelagibaculum spongiae TaxID=2080658 RepID=A0A2V1GWY4_9GAMM|nr:glycerol-3-phosphate 1-O-acyltransferase PlsY [Pelagibaculum spongiae]PVZ65645.1 acyl-phosphate glycerol 3-phosphate acyltransferase [Pelagibaculum spongiae]
MSLSVSVIALLMAYLLGSLSSAIVVCRLMGLPDPRGEGSGNPGTTNVLRIGGKKAAIFTLLGDSFKALIPVAIIQLLGGSVELAAWGGFAAIMGHLFPVFFKFQGGKGVATWFGLLLGLYWPLGLLAIAIWLSMAVIFRYSSLAALTAVALVPVACFWLLPSAMLPTALMAVVIYIRHAENISRLVAGQESKIGKKS